MMGKLSLQYEIATLKIRTKAEPAGDVAALGRSVTERAYGLTRRELENKWSGLYDFSAVLVEAGVDNLARPDEFRTIAVKMCIDKFEHLDR